MAICRCMLIIHCDVFDKILECMFFRSIEDVTSISWIFILFACFIALVEVGRYTYNFKSHHLQEVSWGKILWPIHIPPSKYLIVWRLMHDKVPTDDKLKQRVLQNATFVVFKKNQPSICSFFIALLHRFGVG